MRLTFQKVNKRGVVDMQIKHTMKDGVVKTDIMGHVVQRTEVKTVYNLIEQMNKRRQK